MGGGEGVGRVSAGNLGELGGGAKYFFRGRNARQEYNGFPIGKSLDSNRLGPNI